MGAQTTRSLSPATTRYSEGLSVAPGRPPLAPAVDGPDVPIGGVDQGRLGHDLSEPSERSVNTTTRPHAAIRGPVRLPQ